MKTMYKITRTIDGQPAGTLYNFPYIKDARKRLGEIAAMCRGEITETTRNSFTAIQWGKVFHLASPNNAHHPRPRVRRMPQVQAGEPVITIKIKQSCRQSK